MTISMSFMERADKFCDLETKDAICAKAWRSSKLGPGSLSEVEQN